MLLFLLNIMLKQVFIYIHLFDRLLKNTVYFSDPSIDGTVLDVILGCDVPYYTTPYNAASQLPAWSSTAGVIAAAVALTALSLFV